MGLTFIRYPRGYYALLLANLIAALPLLANAQDDPRIVQRQAAGAKEPRIEIVRVKRTDSAAPEFQISTKRWRG